MPFENYYSCRILDPEDLTNFRQVDRGSGTRKVRVLIADKDGQTVTQGYRYDKRMWKQSKARVHCESKGGEFHN